MTHPHAQTIGRRAIWVSAACAVLGTLGGRAGAQGPQQDANADRAVSLASVDSDPLSVRRVTDLAAALRDTPARILPVIGKGPAQNVADLLNHEVTAALLPSDVLPYLGRMGRLPKAEQSLRYIATFARQDVHILAVTNVADVAALAGLPVSIGPTDSRTGITASLMFDSLGIRIQPVFLEPAAALQALQQRRIAALVHVARKPAPLFFALNQGDGVHFLPVPQTPELARIYLPSRLGIADYPLLIGQGEAGRGQPIPTAAVPIVMGVANPAPGTTRYRNLVLLIDALFPLAAAAPKGAEESVWTDVDPALEVPGWRRFTPATARLQGKPVPTGSAPVGHPAARSSGSPAASPADPTTDAARQQQREKLFEEYMRWLQTQNRQ